jgi:endoglucanase
MLKPTFITPLLVVFNCLPCFAAQEMIRNGSFDGSIDGWWSAGASVSASERQACVDIVSTGSHAWSVILGHGGVGLAKGERYEMTFDAYANVKTQFKTLIQHEGPPYTHYIIKETEVTPEKRSYRYEFVHEKPSDAGAEFQFQMGAQKKGQICFSNVSLIGEPYVEVKATSPIRTNQVGFLPKADKLIFVKSDRDKPLRWTLVDGHGISIDMGRTTPTGLNRASGEKLHQIDLSSYTHEMSGLKIRIDRDESFPFDIRSSIYHPLKYDALSYFYQNRSGIAIDKQYLPRADLARPAGHLPDIVSCFDKEDAWGNVWPGCDFSIDATKGWYDAGDHGKYVVNSGISTWTLLNLYERGQWLKSASVPFNDDQVAIPEANNGVNPLLSEARWNIEFMLAMQIPANKQVAAPIGDQSSGKTLKLTRIDAADLVFHKVADEVWTGAPLAPHQDTQKRYVGQPSTAATLNLAAIGAQCARIWKGIDTSFANRCLTAATKAWAAAARHPNIFAYDNFTGSGPYGDIELDDEFYWAAAELFITTGEVRYGRYLKASPLYLNMPKGDQASTGDIFWQYTAPLGTISLAVVPNLLGDLAIDEARAAMVATANNYRAQMAEEGYRIPYSVKEYPWGSNSNLVNRGLFLIYGYDFTGDLSFVKAAAHGLDYLLGANPNNISYITGYGSYSASKPHHRFWANSVDSNYPKPAPGALIGGPNSISFSDPIAGAMKGHCVGQTCYTDKMNAWTMNEITINWNAPLVWIASALDEGKLN